MSKRPRLPRPVTLKDVLQGLIKPGDWRDLELRTRIREAWEAALPPALLSHTRLTDLRRKELWVEVSSSPWVQELQFLKPSLLKKLEYLLGQGVVVNLRFQVGSGFRQDDR